MSVNDNGLTSEGLSNLNKFYCLEYISMSGNQLQDKDIEHIIKINPDIVFLGLSRNKFTDAVIARLIQLKELEVLLLDRNQIKK